MQRQPAVVLALLGALCAALAPAVLLAVPLGGIRPVGVSSIPAFDSAISWQAQ